MPTFRTIQLSDASLRVAIEGAGPLVVLVHGFPESWYSWRHQLKPIAEAGFTACAIDVRGYGGSSKPYEVDAYTLEAICGDIAELIQTLSPGVPAAIIGHDWGAPICWTTALVHPSKVRAVAGMSVPYVGVPTRSLNDIIEEEFVSKGRFFYQNYFAKEGVAEEEMQSNVGATLRKFYFAWSGDAADGTWPSDKTIRDTLLHRLPDPQIFPIWLSETDLNYLTKEFEAAGFRGALNRYRNHDRDFAFLKKFAGRDISQPSLFITGERDPSRTMFGDRIGLMKKILPDLRAVHVLPGCGHWTQQERPQDVSDILVSWLRTL